MGQILPITDGHGRLLGDAAERIRAIIAYPSDADWQARDEFHSAILAATRRDERIMGADSAELQQHARMFIPRVETAALRELRAWIAAELFLTVLS
jgi:hypothetical protein